MKHHEKIILVLIVIIGVILRLVALGDYPSGFFRDEAALGYNAYSIWGTGKDEYGLFLPLVFRSFEVFFLPLYVYLSAPIVGLLGLSEFSTRLLSAVSGVVAIPLVYLITKELLVRQSRISLRETSALFAAFVLAVSPWHIFYSRGAFEGNLALTLFAAGFLFWIKFVKNWSSKFFFLSVLFFAISIYSYQAERLVVPFFALVAVSLVYKKLWEVKEKLVFPGIVILLILLPIFSLSLKPGGYHRAFGVSIFSQTEPPGWVEGISPGILINNEYSLRGRQFLSLYLSYFSPRNLFIEGDFDRQRSVDNFSVFYAFTFPFLLIGLWRGVQNRTLNIKLLFTLTLIAPIPAAMTGDPFHTYRSLLLYLPLTIFIGMGLGYVTNLLKGFYKPIFVVGVIGLSSLSLIMFLYSYLVLTQATRARAWDHGYKEIVSFVNTLPDDTRVVVDDPWTESYIHFLFFGKLDPVIYHKEVEALGPVDEYYYSSTLEERPNKLGSYEFRPVDWPSERGDTGTVFIMTAERLPESEFITDPKVELITEIYYPTGEVAYRIVRIL